MALLTTYTSLWLYSLGTHAELEQRMTKQGLQEIMGNVYDLAGDPTHDAPFSYATQGSNPGLADPRQLCVLLTRVSRALNRDAAALHKMHQLRNDVMYATRDVALRRRLCGAPSQ